MVRSQRHGRTPYGVLAALALAAVTAGVSGVLHAQGAQLQLFISATDASGQPVTDLKAEEISMSENGAAGKVSTLEPFSLPVKLTIAVDNGAESAQALGNYRTGLQGLVEALPPDVEVTLITTAPQPRMVVRPTTNREEIIKGISRFGPDPDEAGRFTDTLVEFAERIEKDARDKKLNYAPVMVMVSTTQPEVTSVQIDTVEKAFKTLVTRGARVSVAMTTTKAGDQTSLDFLNNGRQALIAIPIAKQTRGKYEALAAFSRLATLLPEWGKEIADMHNKQKSQFRVVIDRPNGATGPLNGLDMRLTRPGLNGAVSGDGRFIQ